jgi:hypothetical protein
MNKETTELNSIPIDSANHQAKKAKTGGNRKIN